MKLAKRIATLLVVLCMTFGCSMLAFAANGQLMFTDPSTKVGEVVEVKGVVQVDPSLGLEDMTINLKYDTSKLKFKSADEVTEVEPGKLTFSRVGVENPYRVEYFMSFEVLAEGTTKIEILDCNVWTTTDEKVYPALGTSTITIAPGEVPPAEEPVAPPVEEPTDVPTETPSGEIKIRISDTTTITLLSEISQVTLPSRYLATTVSVDGSDFPAWQDTQNTHLCILYATNNNGENALYQYDSREATYQRFEVPSESINEEKESIMEMIQGLFQDDLDYVVLGVGATFILFVIIILVLSIKLYNRNAELDELYEEYDLYEEEEEKEKVQKVEKKEEKKVEKKTEKSRPVVVKEPIEFVNINDVTVDDIVITADDDIDFEEDNEIEVEFYEQVEEVAVEETPVVKEPVKVPDVAPVAPAKEDEEYYDDENLDLEFEVDFIDLDD